MTGRRPWVRGAMPWLTSGPLHRVRADALPAVDVFLAEHDYVRIELDGRRMTTRAGVHAELATAFGFPDWYGGSWDAFNDCFHEVEARHRDGRLAVVWTDFDVSAAGAPASVAEAVGALLDAEFHRELVLDVFAVASPESAADAGAADAAAAADAADAGVAADAADPDAATSDFDGP